MARRGKAGRESNRGDQESRLGSSALTGKLVGDPAVPHGLATFSGWLGESSRSGSVLLYLTAGKDEFIEFSEADIRHRTALPERMAELGETIIWLPRSVPVRWVWRLAWSGPASAFDEGEAWDALFEDEWDWDGDEWPDGDSWEDGFDDFADCPSDDEPLQTSAHGGEADGQDGCVRVSGFLGAATTPGCYRLYLTPEFDLFVEFAEDAASRSAPLPGSDELEETQVWFEPETEFTFVYEISNEVPAGEAKDGEKPSGDGAKDGDTTKPKKMKRPSWREWIRRHFPVRPGEHRRHIVSYRWLREFSKHLDDALLRELGFDPAKLGGTEEARRAWVRHHFNNPRNFWRGNGWVNSWLGRWMRWYEPFNWDFPSPEQWERELERREREARERRAREERDLQRREREERERREREERERQERERQERERREREERERRERERRERERRERELRERNRRGRWRRGRR